MSPLLSYQLVDLLACGNINDMHELQDRYAEQVTQRRGPDFDWRTGELDVDALYESGGGRKHGR
jgi:hypothetical protein